ncbi:hypothetical protein N9W01_00615 [bacterium]|nr:hypothetical protein [bacterium]
MKTFKDIQFFQSMGGNLKSITEFDNGFEISVIAGEHAYSTPRESSLDPDFFSEFEIAIFNDDGEFVTKDFLPGHDDGVLGWQNRGQINALMLLVQSKV